MVQVTSLHEPSVNFRDAVCIRSDTVTEMLACNNCQTFYVSSQKVQHLSLISQSCPMCHAHNSWVYGETLLGKKLFNEADTN